MNIFYPTLQNFFQEYNSVANVSHSDFAFRNYLQNTVHSHVSAWR